MSNEHTQHRGIDNIIESDRHNNFWYALSLSSQQYSSDLSISTEERYRLAGFDNNPDAQSNTLVTIPSMNISRQIQVHRLAFTNLDTADHLYWSTLTHIFSIIGFAGEFKRDDASHNKNQVIMILMSAQLQQKALSLKKSIIMGATSCRGHVQIYSSYWDNADDSVCSYIYQLSKCSVFLRSFASAHMINNSFSPSLLM